MEKWKSKVIGVVTAILAVVALVFPGLVPEDADPVGNVESIIDGIALVIAGAAGLWLIFKPKSE